MPENPTLLFLHGVNEGEDETPWKTALDAALNELGHPDLGSVRVIAPKYAHLLDGVDDDEPVPEVTIRTYSGDEAKGIRREFEQRSGAIELRLGRHQAAADQPLAGVVIGAAVKTAVFRQARNYLDQPRVRSAVLRKVLTAIPSSGKLVIVGHSLGSVIAADIIRRLPVGLEVAGMLTVGSPLGSGIFDVDKLRGALKDPPSNLAWWVNVWNANDPVASMRGVSSVFPWMVDLRVQQGVFPSSHSASTYLSEPVVAEAIGFALFGSRSQELDRVETGVDIPLDDAERLALMALRYGYLVAMHLTGEKQERYTGALRILQAKVLDDIKTRNLATGRPLPAAVAALDFDVTDPMSTAPTPRPARHLSEAEAVVPFVVLASDNVIRPIEISVSRDVQESALSDLSAETGISSQFGKDVFAAFKQTESALSSSSGVNWLKWGAIGAGAAVLVAATGGLALAAGPGLVGAAAITSALAAFGPGGMIGGLVTAGALVTAGGGGVAFGLASPETPAETLMTVVERQVAAEVLRKQRHLESDPIVWRNLIEIEIELRRQLERLDEFSDTGAPLVKELRRKLITVERALKYLKSQGLAAGSALIDEG